MGKRKAPKKMPLRPNDLKKAQKQSELDNKTEQQESQVDPQVKKKPWMKEGLSERVPKPMSVRLSEVDQAKLDYILANTTHKSKHKFCMEVIKRAINRALKEID